jgi:hypothetical protein
VPRQYSTGGKAKLLGISKRGNIYLRKVLIHGARAAAIRIKRDRFSIGTWMDALEARAPRNVLVVAMANKLARIAWLSYQAEKTTDRYQASQRRPCNGTISTDLKAYLPKSAQEQQGRKNSHNGVPPT